MAAKYLYCVTSAATPPPPVVGLGGRPVHTVTYRHLSTVVSDAAGERYPVSRANTLAHQQVIEATMKAGTVLPVRFGTIAQDETQVVDRLLSRKLGELSGLLQRMSGKHEMGLKVLWKREVILAEVAREAQIAALRAKIASEPPERTHYQRIELGQLVEQALDRRRDDLARAMMLHLRPVIVEARTNKLLGDMMVLNAALLIESSREPELDQLVSDLDAEYGQSTMLKYVGPLAPFNFVTLVVRWDEGELSA